jgi:uncharacterized Zn-binding protein involved in type VI secretion
MERQMVTASLAFQPDVRDGRMGNKFSCPEKPQQKRLIKDVFSHFSKKGMMS